MSVAGNRERGSLRPSVQCRIVFLDHIQVAGFGRKAADREELPVHEHRREAISSGRHVGAPRPCLPGHVVLVDPRNRGARARNPSQHVDLPRRCRGGDKGTGLRHLRKRGPLASLRIVDLEVPARVAADRVDLPIESDDGVVAMR